MTDADERVLVTGGTGFIGSYVARELLEHDCEVVAYDASTGTAVLESLGVADDVTVRRGDVTDPTDLIRALRETGASRVVHLASTLMQGSQENPRRAIDVNIRGTNNVLEAARILDDQIERIAWASSMSVYGPAEQYEETWLDEDDPAAPETIYGGTKAYNEVQAENYHRDYGVSAVGIRPTVVYGPYRQAEGTDYLLDVVEKPAVGEPFRADYGEVVFDWQYVADVARAFRMATFAPEDDLRRRTYNTRGTPVSLTEVAEVVTDLLPDADVEVTTGGDLPWGFSEGTDVPIAQRLDGSAAREDLGFEPAYDLESGIREYVNALREQAGLPTV